MDPLPRLGTRAAAWLLAALACAPAARATTPSVVDVDVMVVYTPGTAAFYAGNIHTRVNHLLNVTNQIYADSEVGLNLRLVRLEQVSYSETATSNQALNDITFGSVPALSHIANLRNEVGADMVIFMRPYVGDGICGLAWVGGVSGGVGNGGNLAPYAGYMYAHVSIDCDDYVTAHELGHNMGLVHSRPQNPNGGTFPHAAGYGSTGNFVTVMAYASFFGVTNSSKVYEFSNPTHTHSGQPIGVSSSDPTNGADAVSSLNAVRATIGGFKASTLGVTTLLGHITGDGRADLFHHDADSGKNYIWTTGAANSGLGTEITAVDDTNQRAIAAGDFDGDGDVDIVFRHQTSGRVYLWYMNGASHVEQELTQMSDLSWRIVRTGDFNGDGRADLLWRNLWSGVAAIWLLDGGSSFTATAPATVGLNWTDQGAGDFDGDGTDDLLWRNSTDGNVVAWLMQNGLVQAGGALLAVPSTKWQVGGCGDFNFDGTADVFWHNTDGLNAVWHLSGASIIGGALSDPSEILALSMTGVADSTGDGRDDLLWTHPSDGAHHLWEMFGDTAVAHTKLSNGKDYLSHMVAVGDFSGDGRADLFWRNHGSGANKVWLMNGTTPTSKTASASLLGADWKVVTRGDMNGDGRQDLVWRHQSSGEIRAWLMNGTSVSSTGTVGTLADLNWRIKATGDLNGDGKDDLLWRNDVTGANFVYFMNGVTASGAPIAAVGDLGWKLQASGDLNGDGRDELIWRHSVDGSTHAWFMNGASITGGAALLNVGANTDWRVVGCQDADGDGDEDLYWRSDKAAATVVWVMNGANVVTGHALPTVGGKWTVDGVDDFNGDGKADLLFVNNADSMRVVWIMNVGTPVEQTIIDS